MAKTTLGTRFKNICFVGLNRVEYFPENSEESIFADTWQDVSDDHSRKSMALCFFAPRDLDGEPVDPYVFLSEADEFEEQDSAAAQQQFGDLSLLDLCRFKGAEANTVNILVAADIIFHWDSHDSYIQPTSAMSWARDVKMIIKGYPRSTEKFVYTSWDTEKLQDLGVKTHAIHDLPLDTHTWVNMPTFQEKWGSAALAVSLIFAMCVWGALHLQNRSIDALNEQMRVEEMATPKGQNFEALDRLITEQQQFMRYRNLVPLITKDVAYAIQTSGMDMESFEIENPNPNMPTDTLVATIKAKKGTYNGWLQEEPIAKAVLGQSVTMKAIRKPPGGQQLILEGLIPLGPLTEKVNLYQEEARQREEENRAFDDDGGSSIFAEEPTPTPQQPEEGDEQDAAPVEDEEGPDA